MKTIYIFTLRNGFLSHRVWDENDKRNNKREVVWAKSDRAQNPRESLLGKFDFFKNIEYNFNMNRKWFAIVIWLVIIVNFSAIMIVWMTKSLEMSGISPYLFFYLSLWLASGATLGYFGFLIREKLVPKIKWPYFVGISLREGFLLATIPVLSSMLYHLSRLNWWIFLIILIIPIGIEIYFLYRPLSK